MKQNTILVTCPKACSSYLKEDIESLGFEATKEVPAGVFTHGDYDDCIKLNLQLRAGLRVLWEVGKFRAVNANDLFKKAYKLPWESWLDEDGYFSINSSVRNETITNTGFAALRLKDAIVDRIRDKTDERPDTGNDHDKAVIFLFWHEEEVCIYLDTSGKPLSNRGYRMRPGKAPMRENLAASVLLASKWDRQSTLINPMCGSGTVAIEAALLALKQPAGLLRDNYGFMHTKLYHESTYQTIRENLEGTGKDRLDFKIYASDIDPEMIEAAKDNAAKAGVDHLIKFEVADFRDLDIPDGPGTIILNPEYGERLGDERKLESTYKDIGDIFKRKCSGYWGYVFTGNRQLGKRVGLKAKRRIEFYNGPIECRLLEYEMYSGTRNPKYRDQTQ